MVNRKKKLSNSNNRKKKLLTLIGVIAFVLLVVVIALKQGQVNTYQKTTQITLPTAMPTPSVREYHSDFLKISFSVPSEFEVSELDNDIALKSNMGEIAIERISTNYDTIEGYLFGLSDLNKLEITNKQKVKINGMDVIICKIKSDLNDDLGSRSYFFSTAPWMMFALSTSTPELFDELDQIAQSFRYEP